MEKNIDVLVIGAGPSGSILSSLLHKNGLDVLVVDKEVFPRFVIGESLLPFCMHAMEQAGLLDAVMDNEEKLGFQYKNGAAFARGADDNSIEYTYIDFCDKSSKGFGTTFQVRRGVFDKLLIDTAAKKGVNVLFGVKAEKFENVKQQATKNANTKIRDIMYAKSTLVKSEEPDNYKEVLFNEIAEGKHDDEVIEMEIVEAPKALEIMAGGQDSNLTEMFSGFLPKRKRVRKMTVATARKHIVDEESSKLIDMDAVNEEGINRAEQEGIIFIDEIDKIAMTRGNGSGPDVSREGVQRDILPFVEGCNVTTKYGTIRTDYILFIAAGAFHIAKVEDLIPELQGRFPIRVDLESLTQKDFLKILTQPKNAITKQHIELLKVDNINLSFDEEALGEIAKIAELENNTKENIGARRLYTIMEKLLEEISFEASGDHPVVDVKVTKEFVTRVLGKTLKEHDLSKYIM